MRNKMIRQVSGVLLIVGQVFSLHAQEKTGWKLVWNDEFNYTGLPDPKKWGYESGHIRNTEQQYYTKARKENVWVQNDVLTITGRKESYPNAMYKKGTGWQYADSLAQYTSASINTEGLAGWRYGRIEVRAKLPAGGGIWPAIWMMGTNRKQVGWPACGEIDIMEFVGNHPTDIYGTIHFGDSGGKTFSSGGKTTYVTLNDDFHLYALEWDDQSLDIWMDDKKFHHFAIDSAGKGSTNPFRKEFYLMLNLAMGAQWPGPVDDAVLPQQFLIDYVRVYKKNEN